MLFHTTIDSDPLDKCIKEKSYVCFIWTGDIDALRYLENINIVANNVN